jgi:hypothetical protein
MCGYIYRESDKNNIFTTDLGVTFTRVVSNGFISVNLPATYLKPVRFAARRVTEVSVLPVCTVTALILVRSSNRWAPGSRTEVVRTAAIGLSRPIAVDQIDITLCFQHTTTLPPPTRST